MAAARSCSIAIGAAISIASVLGCGSRTELLTSTPLACSADLHACSSDVDCCSELCVAGVCGKSACAAGDPPVRIGTLDLATSAPFADASVLGLPNPIIAQTTTDLYVATESPFDAAHVAAIVRVNKRGAPIEVVTTAERGRFITSIAIDGDDLFFSTDVDVRRISIATRSISTIAKGSPLTRIDGIALDPSFVYLEEDGDSFTTTGAIERVPRGGGDRETVGSLFTGAAPGGIVSGNGHVYYGGNGLGGGLFLAQASNAMPASLVSVLGTGLIGFVRATDDDSIYFQSGTDSSAILIRAPYAGGTFTLVSSPGWWSSPAAPQPGQPGAFGAIALDPSHIYFTAPSGAIFAIPKSGEQGRPAQSLFPDAAARTLASDRTCLYWTSCTHDAGCTEAWRAPLAE